MKAYVVKLGEAGWATSRIHVHVVKFFGVLTFAP